ncbi:hypothetical protein [Alicyclobacillus acidocaldarius]|uniref:NADH/Ubiquinone/plastoquinone (Complex I) n=1 Tax=Alicyclobacillus acidocaldarius (strain Tc-4-1) TaxID=1048834 RepID=F8IEG9_ALIAT|nr:hypothetical protein [Alicyclobacillus acidocaldarius]AEJ42683.1 NADH/Ubiquinone/plastoquinone (complex I) [Alicyclobacillus acidocaldarius subsp. acidocaldarius Tc-4-1]
MDFVNVREVVAAWVLAWIAAGMTGALVQPLREPSRRIGIHLASLGLVSLVSVVGLVTGATGVPLGPLHPTGLGWAISLYISALGLVVLTFSARHLAGDERYGSYLAWMTWILFLRVPLGWQTMCGFSPRVGWRWTRGSFGSSRCSVEAEPLGQWRG